MMAWVVALYRVAIKAMIDCIRTVVHRPLPLANWALRGCVAGGGRTNHDDTIETWRCAGDI